MTNGPINCGECQLLRRRVAELEHLAVTAELAQAAIEARDNVTRLAIQQLEQLPGLAGEVAGGNREQAWIKLHDWAEQVQLKLRVASGEVIRVGRENAKCEH